MIEHSQLRAYATQVDISELCDEALQYGFHAVAVNPAWAPFCAKKLAGSRVGVCVTVGFPLGANTAQVKLEEARDAARNGATELDMVINIGALKSGYPGYVEREIAAVVKAVRGIPVKVILETSYLTRDEKIAVCEMSIRAGAAFVKTSTGYGQGGATIEDVTLMKQVVGDQLGIKAAGGIRTYGDAVAVIQAGATRIGTSAGVEIFEDAPQ
ncbi:MAG TPA: deoxyribose-phosphate aldolase [Candidatus Hydrogenedentes bacterium]|nr:deoxyribose-phosphate aldolase [Candidatus Hydrogenedentota bacterium]HNT87423.1 deoxyribose-phosphate aldolase [Candidatus Hydrogenedentota bacterium]